MILKDDVSKTKDLQVELTHDEIAEELGITANL